MTDTYSMSDAQWSQVNSALLVAISLASLHNREVHDKMIKASIVMDDLVDASELADTPPLSTYPEDRERLLALCAKAAGGDDENAIELADLVKAILEDEAA